MKKLLLILIILALIPVVIALRNPAAVYCEELGYEYVVNNTGEGDYVYCGLPDGEIVDAWDFLQGKTNEEFTYCGIEGYELKEVFNPDICVKFMTESCAVCVLEDSEVEVTELMGLTFAETTCGDERCGVPETYATCPEDCPSGSIDGYCDMIKDNICDFDCEEDPDCQRSSIGVILLIILSFVLLLFLVVFFFRKKSKKGLLFLFILLLFHYALLLELDESKFVHCPYYHQEFVFKL